MSSQRSYDQQSAVDIMAQLQDPHWAMEAARIEEEANCDIGAGRESGARLGQLMADPYGFHQFQRLRSLVLGELRRVLTDGSLGAGTDAAWLIAKERLLLRLQQPTLDIQLQLKSVLEEVLSTAECDPLSTAAQVLLQHAIYAALTAEDWDDIAVAAANAIQQHITHCLKLPQSV